MEEKIEILEDFKDLEIFLIGNPKQFIIYQGETYCIRKECDTCPHINNCEFEEELIQSNSIEHPRRGIAFEKKSFLVLRLKKGLDFKKDIPKELWDCEYSDLSLNENNIHYILVNTKSKFRVLKGHFRFYGNVSEFETSEYKLYFDIFTNYEPKHYVVAMDLSSIEPKVSTIVSREPEWLKIFQGTPKVVAKEIEIKE
jgi:hypothetical protein